MQIRADVVDAHGVLVPDAANALTFALAGPARLLGTGNGDPTNTQPDHSPTRNAFNGSVVALVQAAGGDGLASLTVSGQGLAPARLALFAHSAPKR